MSGFPLQLDTIRAWCKEAGLVITMQEKTEICVCAASSGKIQSVGNQNSEWQV